MWKSENTGSRTSAYDHAHNRSIYVGPEKAFLGDPTPPADIFGSQGLATKIEYRPTTAVARQCGPKAQMKKTEIMRRGAVPARDRINARLYEAVCKHDLDAAEAAIKAGAAVNFRHPSRNLSSPLMKCCCDGWVKGAAMLVGNYAADVDTKNAKGDTALMKAVIWDKQKIVELLLSKGADLEATSEWGCTALDYAKTAGNMRLVRTLQEHVRKQTVGLLRSLSPQGKSRSKHKNRTSKKAIDAEAAAARRIPDDQKLAMLLKELGLEPLLPMLEAEAVDWDVLGGLDVDDLISIGFNSGDAVTLIDAMAEVADN